MTTPSLAVTLQVLAPLAIVRLQDHTAGNRFSPALRRGLTHAMAAASAEPAVGVIVLEGLPTVFCAGATLGQLLGDHEERMVIGRELIRALLHCPLPVIVAAQGHAIGGGLLLALCGDIGVLSEQSSYAANFMTFGFTPSLGASDLLPAKLGASLGQEMLYTGRAYRGVELAQRGAGLMVVDHAQVPGRARRVAARIAQAPRQSLELLKIRLSSGIRETMERALSTDDDDHRKTTANAAVRARITTLHTEGRQP